MAKAQYLFDDFSTDSGKWYETSIGSSSITGGYLELTPNTDYGGIETVEAFDLTDSYFSAKLVQNADVGLGSISTYFIANVAGGSVQFDIGGGRLLSDGALITMREVVGGTPSATTITYDPDVHVWFRIRQSTGPNTIFWETSQDGETWTIQRNKTTTLDLSVAVFDIAGGYWDAESPTVATIDDVGLFAGPIVIPGPEKTETLTDSFNSTDTLKWSFGAGVTVSGGHLSIESTDSYHGIKSIDTFTIIDSFISTQLLQNLPTGNGTFISELAFLLPDNDTRLAIQFEGAGGYIYFIERIGGVNSTTAMVISEDRHKYFRIRVDVDGHTVHWETSIDGAYWTVRRTKTTTMDLSRGYVRLSNGFYGSESSGQYIIFDNVNVITGNEIGPDVPFKVEKFTDAFDIYDETKWYTGEGTWYVDNGALRCNATSDYAYIISFEEWDLTESHMDIELVRNTNLGTGYPGNVTTEYGAKVDNVNYVKFIISGGDYQQIILRDCVDGVKSDSTMTYIKERHRYFRIAEHDGSVLWQTSANGITWDTAKKKVVQMDLTNINVLMTCGYWDAESETDPGYVLLDNFNLPDQSLLGSIGIQVGAISIGCFDGGTVQARNFFEKADWLWNPIPDNPILDPYSKEISSLLTSPGDVERGRQQHHAISWGWFSTGFVHFNEVKPDTPRYNFEFLAPHVYPDWGFHGKPFDYAVPVPYGTQIPPGWDGHLSVADPLTGKVFSFWQAFYNESEDKWYASWGAISDFHGDGRDYAGSSTATNLCPYAGTAKMSEIIAGEIPHALFVSSNMIRGDRFRYPAQKSDGRNHANVPIQYAVEEGCRLQLNPDINLELIPGITQIELTLGRAWQKYGAYVSDQGGLTYPPTVTGGGVELWQGMDYTEWRTYEVIPDGSNYTINWLPYSDEHYPPVPEPYAQVGVGWDYFGLDHIPWNDENGNSNLRVLKNWDGK